MTTFVAYGGISLQVGALCLKKKDMNIDIRNIHTALESSKIHYV